MVAPQRRSKTLEQEELDPKTPKFAALVHGQSQFSGPQLDIWLRTDRSKINTLARYAA
jgi:hypothetical protein